MKKLRQGDSSLEVRMNRLQTKVNGSKMPKFSHLNPKKGELNWAPSHLPGETSASNKVHKDILKEEVMKQVSHQDASKISSLMNVTYSFRRELINSKATVQEIHWSHSL
ncbi:hypothetical protein JTE90_013380 [Oedothorax gibbosus]|uniref:Uncharacterized protein n=1 Tax=Oedothorax gibbosus TaxID=931172 RepID=A0AAV6TUU2_9ARAC|nr:hypothetical protein JTE90_013380 [Oedothorax gibbosus]